MKTYLLVQAFRRHQTCQLVASLVVAATCLVLPEAVRAFSITGVALTPPSPVPAGSNLVMTVSIVTPSAPPGLYRPTSVSVQGNQVFVDVYPTSGMLTVIGQLSTNVNLGVLPGGTYQYEVRLFPEFPVGWGVRTNQGSFSVLPLHPPPPTNHPPFVNFYSPPDGARFSAPANIRLITYAEDPEDGNNLTVEFFNGGSSLGFGTFVPSLCPAPFCPNYSLVWSNVPAGKYELMVLVTDHQGATTNSGPVHVSVLASPPTNPPPVVTITARDPLATEGTNCYRWPGWPTPLPATCRGTNTASFVVRRSGDTNASLTVHYQIGGTASNGVDYLTLPGMVVIPAGQRIAPISLVPLDDALPERIETVVLSVYELPLGSPLPPPYTVGKPGRAAAIIVDNDQPRPGTGRLPDRCFHLTQPASNGTWFRIECSTDFVHWTSLGTNSVTDGAVHFVDPDADAESQRFYRAVAEPIPVIE
jgi:hypothetical protein